MDSDLKEMKEFITDRLENRIDIFPKSENASVIIEKVINLDEEFLDMELSVFSNDDEIKYIQEHTGYDYELIEEILWERYCFEMKNDCWKYDAEYCINCGEDSLYFKEIPDKDRGEKIVCKNCNFEMKITEDGLKPL